MNSTASVSVSCWAMRGCRAPGSSPTCGATSVTDHSSITRRACIIASDPNGLGVQIGLQVQCRWFVQGQIGGQPAEVWRSVFRLGVSHSSAVRSKLGRLTETGEDQTASDEEVRFLDHAQFRTEDVTRPVLEIRVPS
jgi:hypothetical protein